LFEFNCVPLTHKHKINAMALRIKEICKERKLLFKDLAKQLGVTDIALRASLKGNPTIGTLEKIAFALNVPITELFEQPQTDVINCPNCGARLSLSKKE
jgi:transcriptional regulator with XRE-family HTH domain